MSSNRVGPFFDLRREKRRISRRNEPRILGPWEQFFDTNHLDKVSRYMVFYNKIMDARYNNVLGKILRQHLVAKVDAEDLNKQSWG
jgi:hypothetical protein